jgi:3-hydroxybutyryl-CoA dehydrogenase
MVHYFSPPEGAGSARGRIGPAASGMSERIQTITVLGAGGVGRAVAYLSALAGYRTILEDLTGQVAGAALEEIRAIAEEESQAGRLVPADAAALVERLEPEKVLESAAAQADLIIEAAPDDLETKIEVYTIIDRAAAPRCVFASTSLLSITEIASLTYRAPQVLGMQFAGPARQAKLVELVRGLETSHDALAAVEQVARRMGKEVVLVKESPGLITGRLHALLGNEAFYLLQEGIASAADIDRAVKLALGQPVGPLAEADETGLDVQLRRLEQLHRALGEKYRPAPLLAQYVKAGRLGRKAGRGVYDYGPPKHQAGKT